MNPAGGELSVPVIDVSALFDDTDSASFLEVATEIDAACRTYGFFSIVGHGADMSMLARLESAARTFFGLTTAEKEQIAMPLGGLAWRGWFPAGGELTSGIPDGKEGIYFGTELSSSDARVLGGLPLHGANQFPANPTQLGPLVLGWLDEMRAVAVAVMRGISVGLGLSHEFFETTLTADPTVLFRIFSYAAVPSGHEGWGVGEHTDYGLLTLLAQDDTGGLQVRIGDRWTDIPPRPDAIVCNLGDMLELMTGGKYRSTPHRVISPTTRDRLSFPYFFDPTFAATVTPVVDAAEMGAVNDERWDGASPLAFQGTYGDYLTAKVAKVFTELFASLGS